MRILAGFPEPISPAEWQVWNHLAENHQLTLCLPGRARPPLASMAAGLKVKTMPAVKQYYGVKYDLALTWEVNQAMKNGGLDAVYLRQSRGLGLMMPGLLKKFQLSLLLEVPLLLEEKAALKRRKIRMKERIYFQNLDFLYYRADRLLLTNRVLKTELNKLYGAEPDKMVELAVLPHLADPSVSSSSPRRDLSGEHRCLGVWAYPEDKGGLEVIVRALAGLKNPHIQLLVLGEKLQSEELPALAASLDLEEQVLLAEGKAKPRNFFAECELMLISGREASARLHYNPGILSRVLHALSWGKPVLAPDFGGLEFLPQNRLGDLYPPGQSRALGEKIAAFLQEDPIPEHNGAAWLEDNFSPKILARRLEELFLSLKGGFK